MIDFYHENSVAISTQSKAVEFPNTIYMFFQSWSFFMQISWHGTGPISDLHCYIVLFLSPSLQQDIQNPLC